MEELEEQFLEGENLFKKLEDSTEPSNNPTYQHQIQQCLLLFHNVATLIENQHVFSSNEELDDIRTDLLRYILVPYYLAELQAKIVDNERFDHLKSAKSHYIHFVGRCEKLKLVHKDDIAALHSDAPADPAARRAILVARMKREKEAKVKLEALREKMSKEVGVGGGVVDEEQHRAYLLALIHVYIGKAVKELELTESELKMLETVSNMPKPPARDSRGNVIVNNNNNNNNSNSNSNNKPIAYTILPGGKRVDLAAQVFRPGFNMATMTPEQAYEAEVRAGRMISGGGGNQKKEGGDSSEEDDDHDDEEKLRKARYWDDFKDDNPRGWGNSKR